MLDKVNEATQKLRAMALINEGLQNLDDAANTVSSVVSEVKSIQDTLGEMKQQREEWQKSKDEAEKAIEKAFDSSKAKSTLTIVTPEDLVKPAVSDPKTGG